MINRDNNINDLQCGVRKVGVLNYDRLVVLAYRQGRCASLSDFLCVNVRVGRIFSFLLVQHSPIWCFTKAKDREISSRAGYSNLSKLETQFIITI